MPYEITEQQQLLQQLTTMVLADTPPPRGTKSSPAYLFTQTSDNQHSVLVKGAKLLRSGNASSLLILDDQNGENRGYPGAGAWLNVLQGFGIDTDHGTRLVKCDRLLHTFSESLALVAYAKANDMKGLIIVAPPFHIVRAFMSTVSAICKLGVTGGLKVYCQVGQTLPWGETVAHSQGTLMATRQNLILTELDRVYRYHEKGDLVSVSGALEYLAWRDQE